LSHQLTGLLKERDGQLKKIVADLGVFAGQDIVIELRVEGSQAPNVNDLPIWTDLRIQQRRPSSSTSPQFVEIKPVSLQILDRTERAGGGDDPFLAALYMRSSLGVAGSTMVEVLDSLQLLGSNVDNDDPAVAIGDAAHLVVRDIAHQPDNPQDHHISGTLIIAAFVAFEEDKRGRAEIRSALRDVAATAGSFLVERVENNPNEVVANLETFREDLVNALVGELTSNGGGFLPWIGRAHDLVDHNGVVLLAGRMEPPASTSSPDLPVVRVQDDNLSLEYSGDDGHWVLGVQIRTGTPGPTMRGDTGFAIAD
jgi:hypothetical protein